jgi:MFS family permease
MTTPWVRIALIYGIGVLAAGQLGIVPPLVPALQRDLGVSLPEAGLAVSILTLVGAVLGLPAGDWCQRVGHARALSIGILIMASAAAVCAAADDASTLIVARGLAGVGYLLVVVAAPSLLASTAQPQHQAFALSLWGTFVPVGIALAGMVVAGFANRTSWRTIFAGDVVLLAAALIVAVTAVRQVGAPGNRDQHVPMASLRSAIPLSLAFFCFALLFLALAGLLPSYLVEDRGMATGDAGRTVAIVTALGIVGSFAAGWLMRRGVAPGRLMAAGLIASTALAALSFTAVVPLLPAIVCLGLSFAVGGLVPSAAFASVPLVAADARAIGVINGLIAQTGSLGSLAGPPVLALWIEWVGWSWAPVLLLSIALVGVACALAIRPAGRKPRRASPPP